MFHLKDLFLCFITSLNDHLPQELIDWHRPRMTALVESGVDLLAIETIPAQKEAEALISLLAEYPTVSAWLTFSCKVVVILDDLIIHCIQTDIIRQKLYIKASDDLNQEHNVASH